MLLKFLMCFLHNYPVTILVKDARFLDARCETYLNVKELRPYYKNEYIETLTKNPKFWFCPEMLCVLTCASEDNGVFGAS